jgi:hypothetical protein
MTQYYKTLNFSAVQLQTMKDMVLNHFSDVGINGGQVVYGNAVFWDQKIFNKNVSLTGLSAGGE